MSRRDGDDGRFLLCPKWKCPQRRIWAMMDNSTTFAAAVRIVRKRAHRPVPRLHVKTFEARLAPDEALHLVHAACIRELDAAKRQGRQRRKAQRM